MTQPAPSAIARRQGGERAPSEPTLPTPRRITAWLLDGGVQRADGGVAGWVDQGGNASYVYPEITGYYLQWLAWRAQCGDDCASLARRAKAAQQWLQQWIGQPNPPPTRLHAVPGTEDWRNRAVFAFDLAMVLRGVAAAAGAELLVPAPSLLSKLDGALRALVANDGQLDACRVHEGGTAVPLRWSTRRGPFLAKAAAGIEAAAATLPGVSATLRAAAAATFEASIEAVTSAPHAETHPQLYALEGYLGWPSHPGFAERLPSMVTAFGLLVAATEARGSVPESQREAGTARLDIVAQMLRVGVLLEHHARGPVLASLARSLAATLETAVLGNGALPFARHGEYAGQRNAWVAMFATQALAWNGCRPAALRDAAEAPAIV